MEMRQARAADWEVLRELRLWALADAPDAFASTLDQEAAFPEQVWRQRAEGGEGSVNFIASEGGAGIGMAAIFAVASVPGRMHLVGMWVDPQHRRQGVAQALVDQAVRWAEERQAREVILWGADHNIPARMLYERIGFRPTGERQPLPSNPVLMESLLVCPSTGRPLGYESFERHSAACSSVRNQPIYRDVGCLPTGSRPAQFLTVSASPVSKS
jgi:GNAT superfamily N-acetyltransferase